MRIALGFLIPCLAYFALYFLLPKRTATSRGPHGLASAFAAFGAALISSLVVLVTLVYAPHWPGNTQAAWTGVEALGQPVSIGGPREQAVVAWPNESFAPSLRAAAQGEAVALLDIADGGGFVLDEKRGEFLNGAPLADGSSKGVGDFTVRVERSYKLWHRVEVVGEDGQTWARFSLPAALIKRDRVHPVSALVEEYCVDAVRADAARMLRLERWAQDLVLLVTRAGDLKLLGTEAQQAQCELPCELSVYWPRRRLPVRLTKEGAKLRVDFRPPRQFVSPLKPAPDGGWEKLVVTGNPLPGDRAFFLPLGHGVGDLRHEVDFRNNSAGLPVFGSQGSFVVGEGASPQLPPHMRPVRPDGSAEEKNVTSILGVQAGRHTFHFATINDLPDFWLAARLLLFALVCLGTGLSVAYRRMPDDTTRWVVYGLTAVVWNLLALRLLLSFRYALSPVSLDALAVKGVATAFLGLTVVPGLLLLFVRLRRDLYARPEGWPQRKKILGGAMIHFFLLLALGLVAYTRAPDIWANTPARPAGVIDYLWYVIVIAVAAYLFLLVLSLYRVDAAATRAQKKAAGFFTKPLYAVEGLAGVGRRAWEKAAGTTRPWDWPKWIGALAFAFVVVPLAAGLVALLIRYAAWAVTKLVAVETFAHDILMPLIFYWPLALLLLGAKLAFRPGEALTPIHHFYKSVALRRVVVRVFLVVLVAVGAALFILPVLVSDAGSVMAVLAILIPTALVMMASPPRRWGALVALALAACFTLVALAFVNIRSVSPYLPSVAVSRILVFKNYDTLQPYLPFEGRSQLSGLRNGYQHTWENQAIAHEGGYTGLGFGNAPTRRSQVRQDTIQYDSVYSFFIASEFGLLGGVALLALYGVPLALVLVGGRLRFDFGYAAATVITGSFLFEALIHAGMNLNLLPFTGRDLPLLTVNSFTDLLRWTILLGVAAQAVLYRYRGEDALRSDADSLVSPPAELAAGGEEPAARYGWAAAPVALAPALLLVLVVASGVSVIRDETLGRPFSWHGMLDVVDSMAKQGFIHVREDQTVGFSPSIPIAPGMLIEQEVARFNALPLEERLGEVTLQKYADRLKAMASTADYDQIMDELRTQSRAEQRQRRESLIELRPPVRWDDGRGVREVGGYRVGANRAFNTSLSFTAGADEGAFPRTTFRDGKVLVGPAWVMGRWLRRYDPAPAVAWTAHLSNALEGEWKRLGKDEAAGAYGRLTLDARLQEAAVAFSAQKGRALHDQLLREGGARAAGEKLPPRVALAVVSLPHGEALALGGWPRMSASRFWTRGPDGREWVPPYDWAEGEAPQSLRAIYGGDRNFDHIVMGSATKPLWATAALKVHPGLDQRLQTRGPEDVEGDVFGIRLVENPGDGWDAGAREWVNFKNYLSKSDNRYHVRLGFLGLAEKHGGEVVPDTASNSEKESLRPGAPAPWKMYPKFPHEINFSNLQPGPLRRLNETALAKHLLNMYGIGVTSNSFERRLSFWTKNAADDHALPAGQEAPASVFEVISPAAADFSLDRVVLPRDYVTLLLGGGYNMWANVDFAAAFGACVTGRPVLAHVVKNGRKAEFLPDREEFTAAAQAVRPGLAAVVAEGTANVPELKSALASLPRGYFVYAKTGTLSAQEGARTTSRIVLALVKWDGKESDGKVKTGLVFSVVGERAGVKTSTVWLGEFISRNRAEIDRLLAEVEAGK